MMDLTSQSIGPRPAVKRTYGRTQPSSVYTRFSSLEDPVLVDAIGKENVQYRTGFALTSSQTSVNESSKHKSSTSETVESWNGLKRDVDCETAARSTSENKECEDKDSGRSVKKSKQSDLRSFFLADLSSPKPRKRSDTAKPGDRPPNSDLPLPRRPLATKQSYEQLHLALTTSTSHVTCPKCEMSYVRGGAGGEDEAMHRRHCESISKGIVWPEPNRATTRDGAAGGAWGRQIGLELPVGGGTESTSTRNGGHGIAGRLVVVEGRLIPKNRTLQEVIDSVDRTLSAPALPRNIIDKCKIFLYLATSSPIRVKSSSDVNSRSKERVLGCVVAQPIKHAMEILSEDDVREQTEDTVLVDPGTGAKDSVVCKSHRLPTKLGVHRLFVVPLYRSKGIARLLLDAACANTIHGYQCQIESGDVAFSQPTNSGLQVMRHWGKGLVRVFIEDEQI